MDEEGAVALARRVRELLSAVPVGFDEKSWGLDHGTWSVLAHVFPNADIPVVQLSIDETQPPDFHFELGKLLTPLRDEGILIIGSGNLVHNLHTYSWGKHTPEPYDWAVRFETTAKELMLSGEGLLGHVEGTVNDAVEVDVGHGQPEGAGQLVGRHRGIQPACFTTGWLR